MGGSFRPRDKPSIHSIDTKPGETQISTTPPLSPLPKVQCLVSSRIPFDSGEYRLLLYKNHMDQYNHLALVFGAISSLSLHDDSLTLVGRQQRGAIDVHPAPQKAVMVRIHSCCFTGETVGSLRCDCGEQLTTAMHAMAAENCGVVLYMQQEGRGIGLMDKLL